jgi:hypothetical protein
MDGNLDLPLDVIELVARCGGTVDELALSGIAGFLLRYGEEWGIVVREGDSRRRRRFTVAHELGHFCMPTHGRRALVCVSPETTRGETDRMAEREANAFAAELLMPRRAVQPMVSSGAIDLTRAIQLAETFDVSAVSAALRLCELTRERAAVLYFRDARLRWAFRCGMPYGLPDTGSPPPPDTIVHDMMSDRAGSADGQVVATERWLPLGSPDPSWGDLLERSVRLDDSGEILTILWLTEVVAQDYDV